MNGKLSSSEQTWRNHGVDLTSASWTTFTGTNHWLKHNRLIQIRKFCKTKRREEPSNSSVHDTQVFLPCFFFLPITFRYHLLSEDNKLLYLFKSIKSSLGTSAVTDWVAQPRSTIWLPHRNFGCPEQLDNR